MGVKKKYFISFVEEAVLNPDYKEYIGGRVEVYKEEEQWAIREIRFFTKKIREFYRFRDKWDFQELSEKELKQLDKKIKKEFYETDTD